MSCVDFEKFAVDNTSKYEQLYSQELSQQGKRFVKFVKAPKTSELFQSKMAYILTSTGFGAFIGGGIGAGVGCLGGIKGMVVGGAVGAGIGASIGLFGALAKAGYSTNQEYKKWLKQHRHEHTIPQFTSLLENHELRQKEIFICPISDEPMDQPVVDIYGHSYNKPRIVEWIELKGTSPKRPDDTLTINDIREDFGLLAVELNEYKKILEREVDKLELTLIQLNGLELLIIDLGEQVDALFRKENKVSLEQMDRLTSEYPKKEAEWRAIYARRLSLIADALAQKEEESETSTQSQKFPTQEEEESTEWGLPLKDFTPIKA